MKEANHRHENNYKNKEQLPFVILHQVIGDDWDDKYGFDALPRSRTAVVEPGHQTLWLPLPT